MGTAILFLALCWSRMTRNGALAGMVVGAATVILWNQAEGGLFDVYELLPGFLFASVAIVVVSLLTGGPSESVQRQFQASRRRPAD